ncbi:MAG TPA: acyl-CoA dehydrogenase family protein [Chroococcales cyanobacterium]
MSAFVLNDDQQQYQKLANEFAQKELAHNAHRFDLSGEIASDILKQSWEIGLANNCIAEELGGLGLRLFDGCIIAEELGAGCAGIYGPLEASYLTVQALQEQGSQAQKERYIKPLAEAPGFAGLADNLLSIEPRTTLSFQLDGESLILTGAATIFNASFAQFVLVLASEAPSGKVRALVVDRASLDSERCQIGAKLNTLGRRASDVRRVEFSGARLATEQVLPAEIGGPSSPWKITVQRAQCFLAAGAIGLARQAMEHAIKYSQERKAFGRPLCEHQTVAFMIADMAKDIEAARLLTWQAALACDAGQEDLVSSVTARAFSHDMAMRVALDAVQIYGGYGYSREYPVEKLMRDAKVYQVRQGDTHTLKAHLGRQLVASAV